MSKTTTTPAVALLFADADLGSHLREVLLMLGASIAYEGPAAGVRGRDLVASGADVVVVNLEPAEEDHLERLYDALEGSDWRVIFNDAEASRDLSGWDKARWARHLAAKLLGGVDVDPPRPDGVRAVEPVPPRADGADTTEATAEVPPPEPTGMPAAAAIGDKQADGDPETRSEALEAELEALLSGQATSSATADHDESAGPSPSGIAPDIAEASGVVNEQADAPTVEIEGRQTVAAPAPVSDWELVDFNTEPAATETRESSSDYGVEKVEASDYLAPQGGDDDSTLEPGLDLELVSLEDAVAPVISDEAVSEMLLDDSHVGIRRVVVVAAGADAGAEIGDFLAALSPSLPVLFLVVQHQRQGQVDTFARTLGSLTGLAVKTASADAVVRTGEAWLVPPGKCCRVKRDGQMALVDDSRAIRQRDPSIDQCLETLMPVFRADVTLLVLSGDGHDALAGAQLVASHGGQVWLNQAAVDDGSSMAHAIEAEELATRSGTPAELARCLIEECA